MKAKIRKDEGANEEDIKLNFSCQMSSTSFNLPGLQDKSFWTWTANRLGKSQLKQYKYYIYSNIKYNQYLSYKCNELQTMFISRLNCNSLYLDNMINITRITFNKLYTFPLYFLLGSLSMWFIKQLCTMINYTKMLQPLMLNNPIMHFRCKSVLLIIITGQCGSQFIG